MSKYGFSLKKLQVVGEKKVPAEIVLESGLNVIAGASNTGKSYLFRCIDFMLGGKSIPKQLKVAQGYQSVLLELQDHVGKIWTLRRSLAGGQYHLMQCPISEINDKTEIVTLRDVHDARKPDNISTFLLNMSGIGAVKVRSNARGDTNSLTIRTINQLFCVSETTIIQEISPVIGNEGFDETPCQSAFKYLITGKDDSQIIALPNTKITRAEHKARLALYDKLISDLQQVIQHAEASISDISERVKILKEQILILSDNIDVNNARVKELQIARREAWQNKQEADSKIININELLSRFALLDKHYDSDLERLAYINEGNHYFNLLEEINCPFCHTNLDTHYLKKICGEETKKFENIQKACIKEASKINVHRVDLKGTMESLQEEKKGLVNKSSETDDIIEEATTYISKILSPQITLQRQKLQQLIEDQKTLSKIELDKERLQELKASKLILQNQGYDKGDPSTIIKTIPKSPTKELCSYISHFLNEWHFENANDVYFDDTTFDIVIGGQPRQDDGKGLRGITYAAFTLGLLKYCVDKNLPHPRLVILDSPVMNYHKEMRSEGKHTDDIESAFYNSLASLNAEQQVIILENRLPSKEIQERINYIEFTHSVDNGCYGFFPIDPVNPPMDEPKDE